MDKAKRIKASWFGAAAMIALGLLLACLGSGMAASKGSELAQRAPGIISKDSDCASCHRTYADSMKNDKMLVNRHAVVTRECSSCHREADMLKAHEKVTQPPPKLFRQRKYPNDMCTACHGTYDKLIEKTKGSEAFKTTQGERINPHKTHVGAVECYNCHKMHKDRPPIEYCYGCHHPRQLNNCKDCHAPGKE